MANGNNPILLRAIAINILMNLALGSGLENEALSMLKTITPVITYTLDSFDAAAQLLQLDELRANTNTQDRAAVKLLDDSTQIWKDALDAQGLILELLSNLLVLIVDDDAGPSDFQEMDEHDESNQLGLYIGKPAYPQLSRFILESGFTTRLLPKCTFVTRQPQSPEQNGPTSDDPEHLSLQQRALGCLLNAVLNSEFEQTTLSGASSLWRELVDHVCAPAVQATQHLEVVNEILSNALSVLAHVIRLVSQTGDATLVDIHADDFAGFISIVRSESRPDSSRTTALSILGLLTAGPWATEIAASDSNVISDVLNLFVEAMRDGQILFAAEAANALMDGFAEPTFNGLTSQIMGSAVLNFIGKLKSAIQTERRNLPRVELDRLDETRVNLQRFLEYKRNQ